MRKPWNLPSYSVYSLITENRDSIDIQIEILKESPKNMNIMTYVIPVSMNPKHYIIALYHGTQSLSNWLSSHRGVLQILSPSHLSLVRILGKKSGKSYDKMRYLSKKGYIGDDGMIIGIAGYIELEEVQRLPECGGDHDLYLCRVVSSRSYHEKVLTTHILLNQNIIL